MANDCTKLQLKIQFDIMQLLPFHCRPATNTINDHIEMSNLRIDFVNIKSNNSNVSKTYKLLIRVGTKCRTKNRIIKEGILVLFS